MEVNPVTPKATNTCVAHWFHVFCEVAHIRRNQSTGGALRSPAPTPANGATRIEDGQDETMSRFAYYGFWACAGVYAAIGLIGVVLLGAQPSIAYSNDGYGTLQPAVDK